MMKYAFAAAALCLAAPSFAATTISFDGRAGTFGNADVGGGIFNDTFTFNLASMGMLGATISSIAIDAASDIDFTSVTFNGIEFTNVASDGYEFRALRSAPALAGMQTLTVSGTSGGNAAYSGTLAFAAATAAVPEPATWALMIGGFGIAGGALRRRQRQTVRVAYA